MEPHARSSNTSQDWSRVFATLLFFCITLFISCTGEEEHAQAQQQTQDSVPFMHAIGVSTLISDSGVIRYHLVTEEWDIFNHENKQASWRFHKGMLMERYDPNFHIDLFVQADTAYFHYQQIWELRGRVRIRNVQGTIFQTEEMFWDLDKHEMWNNVYMKIITPERTLEGYNFRSNEGMTKYSVNNSVGDFPIEDKEQEEAEMPAPEDTLTEPKVIPPAPGKYDFLKKKDK